MKERKGRKEGRKEMKGVGKKGRSGGRRKEERKGRK